MQLFNQTNKHISWDEARPPLEWEPYGAANVPDHLVKFLRAQGFPVEPTPVPPATRTKRAARAELTEEESREVDVLRQKLKNAELRCSEAQRVAEEARAAEGQALQQLKEAAQQLGQLEEQAKILRDDNETFEKLAAEAQAKAAKLEAQLAESTSAKKSSKGGGK